MSLEKISGTLKWVSSRKAKPGKFGAKYEASIVVSKEIGEAFNAKYAEALNAFKQEKAKEFGEQFVAAMKVKQPFYEEVDADKKPTGMWIARASAREFIKGKGGQEIDNRPQVVDGDKKPIEVEVANGSEGSLVVEVRPWALTVQEKTISMPLWLQVIQVTKLTPYSEKQDPMSLL